jgi:hypothetical protein
MVRGVPNGDTFFKSKPAVPNHGQDVCKRKRGVTGDFGPVGLSF